MPNISTVTELKNSEVGNTLQANTITLNHEEWEMLFKFLRHGIEDDSFESISKAINNAHITFSTYGKISVNLFKAMIALGFDVNKKDNHSNSPLHKVAITDNVPLVTAMIEAGANSNAGDSLGELPIDRAYKTAMVQAFLKDKNLDLTNIKTYIAPCGFVEQYSMPSQSQLKKLTSSCYFLTDFNLYYYNIDTKKLDCNIFGKEVDGDFYYDMCQSLKKQQENGKKIFQDTDSLSLKQMEAIRKYTGHSHIVESLLLMCTDSPITISSSDYAFTSVLGDSVIEVILNVVIIAAVAIAIGLMLAAAGSLLFTSPLTFAAVAGLAALITYVAMVDDTPVIKPSVPVEEEKESFSMKDAGRHRLWSDEDKQEVKGKADGSQKEGTMDDDLTPPCVTVII